MSKKSNLIRTMQQILQLKRKGAYATRKNYFQVMQSIIEDLDQLQCLPSEWSTFNDYPLKKLLRYWKNKHNSSETMANKISILRGFLKLIQKKSLLSNKQLGIARCARKNKIIVQKNILQQVFHPITRTILEFEIYFGLTFLESIGVTLNAATIDQSLLIYRDIAHNHQDRRIPIYYDKQAISIKHRMQLLDGKDNLTEYTTHKVIKNIYQAELAVLGIQRHRPFRQLYMHHRFSILRQENTEHVALQTIQRELGISSAKVLQAWLYEQN